MQAAGQLRSEDLPGQADAAFVGLSYAGRTTSPAVVKRLVAVGLTPAVAAVALQTSVHLGNALLFDGRYGGLSADSEYTVFTWASRVAAFTAASVALSAAIVFGLSRLLLLAALLAYFSLDDALRLHERLGESVASLGLPTYSSRLLWPALYVPLLALAFALLWVSARSGSKSARRCVGFGALLLAAAVAAEALSTILFWAGAEPGDVTDVLEVAVEEGAELGGWILIAAGLTAAVFHALLGAAARSAQGARERQRPSSVDQKRNGRVADSAF